MDYELLSFKALGGLLAETRNIPIDANQRYIIISDLHLGNGSASDDFKRNSVITLKALETYFERDYFLILNGDIEELLRFELVDIKRQWPQFFALLHGFKAKNRLIKLVGNHDIDFLDVPDPEFPVEEAIRLDSGPDSIFIFHGHQMSPRLRRPNPVITFILKYIATPLRIRNYSVSADSDRKFKLERTIYRFSAKNRILSVIGHTHRPLFESMSKIDSIRFEMEQLCLDYTGAIPRRRLEIENRIKYLKQDLERILQKDDRMDHRSSLYNASLVVPCLFNSGTVIGKRGITCLEIEAGIIKLIHWFDRSKKTSHIDLSSPRIERIGETDFHRLTIKEDRLEHIFSRIRLLGG